MDHIIVDKPKGLIEFAMAIHGVTVTEIQHPTDLSLIKSSHTQHSYTAYTAIRLLKLFRARALLGKS